MTAVILRLTCKPAETAGSKKHQKNPLSQRTFLAKRDSRRRRDERTTWVIGAALPDPWPPHAHFASSHLPGNLSLTSRCVPHLLCLRLRVKPKSSHFSEFTNTHILQKDFPIAGFSFLQSFCQPHPMALLPVFHRRSRVRLSGFLTNEYALPISSDSATDTICIHCLNMTAKQVKEKALLIWCIQTSKQTVIHSSNSGDCLLNLAMN